MANKGYQKLVRKAQQMANSWNAAKTRMIQHYSALPFGATRKANYQAAIQAATIRFDPDKWRRNWVAKMSE